MGNRADVCVCVCVYKELWQLSIVGLEHFMYTLPECMRIPGAWQPFKILNCQSFFFFFLINCGHSTNVLSCFSHVWLCSSVDCSPSGSSLHCILQAKILEWVSMPSFRGLPDPGIEPVSLVSPALPVSYFPTEPSGKSFGHFSRFETVTV